MPPRSSVPAGSTDFSAALGSPPTGGDPITVITWSPQTPLTRDYCLCESASSPPTPCAWVLGNVVPATHGETVTEDLRRLTDIQKQALQIDIARRPPQANRRVSG